ncbi:heparinase II/III family protein [bacterium]|nr:heparinase II/III family protein [bacterium]
MNDTTWIARIRPDHPRLFFNAGTWPAVRERALTVCRSHYEKVQACADGPPPEREWSLIHRPAPLPGASVETRDWGQQLFCSAFVYLMEPDPQRLSDIKGKLRASAEYYHACFDQGQSVNWYAQSRIGSLAALDWLWDEFTPDERREIGLRLLDHVEQALDKPDIVRRNNGDYRSGLYGDPCLAWYAGLTFHNEGIDDERALRFLRRGYDDHIRLLTHRAAASGDDGGEASPTLGYSFGEYPTTQWNFFYTYRSATGRDIAPDWPHAATMTNYVIWNWLPGGLEFGYGDTPHVTNALPLNSLYTHASHIMSLYGQTHPEWAALAHHLRNQIDGDFRPNAWPIHPFLLSGLEKAPPPQDPGVLPPARHFENMGQVFMRSGSGPDDTYALFVCGGILGGQHRHYDATHFTIYKKGFLALDSGTRQGNTDNLQNYFAQTVAHNCVLIKMPGEPPSRYWNGEVFGQAGGQSSHEGSQVLAFETGPHFTYVAGDATSTYSNEKCSQMARQLLFIPPDHFVIFDRVTSTRADYAKTWLLHHANEPALNGKAWRSDQGQGRIFVQTLLPRDALLEKVGGPGKEFLADGVNYPIDAGPSQYIRDRKYQIYKMDYDEVPELMGRWRMEVRPGSPREEDIFLHLIQVGDQNLAEMSDARVKTSDNSAEVVFRAGDREVALSLAVAGEIGGHIQISRGEQALVDRDLTRKIMPQVGLASLG